MKHIIIILITLALISCNDSSNKNQNSLRDIKITKLDDFKHYKIKDINSSFVGRLEQYNDNVFFIDEYFCNIQVFDKNLNHIDTKLGQGRGPLEIDTGLIYGNLIGEESFFIDPDTYVFKFNKDFERIGQGFIKNYAVRNVNKKRNYDSPTVYTSSYSKYIMREHGDNLFINIYTGYIFSGFVNSDSFKEGKPLLQINKNSFDASIIGVYSDYYKKGDANKLASFHLNAFDIDNNGNFIMSFEADSLINIYDKDFNHISSFGFAGKDMNVDYKAYSEFKYSNINKERETKSYYDWIEHIDKTGKTFRSYRKNNLTKTYGLQIYDDKTLIGDVDVPAEFRVIGYIKPYYYASGKIDEENETINIFRFKL